MSPEKQRIAIAEALNLEVLGNGSLSPTGCLMVRQLQDGHRLTDWYVQNDWLNDLNACHEMEKVLTNDQFYNYLDYLSMVAERETKGLRPLSCATAPQRCEAFLRTIGKWTDE